MERQFRRKNNIVDMKAAIRIYYQHPEIGNNEIKEIFGENISPSTISYYKKAVRAEAAKRGVFTNVAHSVNTELAYEVWGIDIADLERRINKLKELGVNV